MNDVADSTERVLADFGWLRALARKLVADEHLAEDLAQDTLVAALERTRRGEATPRAWLASVLRNCLRQFARGEGSRRDREHGAAREGSLDSPAALLESLEAHRELLEAVRELPEPYRAAVVLRYLRGLPPRSIARELGLSANQASQRVTTGVRMLRERLTARHRGRAREWMALFVPLAFEPKTSATTLTSILAVNTKLVVAAALVLAATVVTVLALRERDEAPSHAQGSAVVAAASNTASLAPQALEPAADEREASLIGESPSRTSEDAQAAQGALAPQRAVRGRVLDALGAPLASVLLSCDAAIEPAAPRSGPDGWFEFVTRAERGLLELPDARWVTVRSGVFRAGPAAAPVVIGAPAIELAGVVVDEFGHELASARIAFELPREFETRFTQSLEATYLGGWAATSAENGRFSIERMPAIEGAELRVALDGYAPVVLPAPLETRADMRVELARPRAPLEGSLSGIVRDRERKPVAKARVALGLTCVLTDGDGKFVLDLARAASADELRAVKEGYWPAVIARPYEPRGGDLGWPSFVEVELPGRSLTLRGRVVDHEERPVAGARVSLADPTHFGVIGMMPTSAEALAAGAPVPPQAIASLAQLPEEDGDSFNDMTMRVGPPTAFWNYVHTDGDGYFDLPGLGTRAYRVKVLVDETLVSFVSDPIRVVDGEALIRMPKPRIWERVAGRVVSRFGEPLAGVTLSPLHEAYSNRSRVWGGNVFISLRANLPSVRTDAEGRFELASIPCAGVTLSLAGGEIVPMAYALDDVKEPAALEISADVRCQIEVVLEAPVDRADRVRVVDADGGALDALVLTEGHVNAYTDLPLANGRSAVFSVSSQAAALELWHDEALVEKHAIRLQPGAPNVLRF